MSAPVKVCVGAPTEAPLAIGTISLNPLTSSFPSSPLPSLLAPTATRCYVPVGRYLLPSSVIMTVVTVHVAGCHVFLCVGGTQAIGSLAYVVTP